MIGRLLGIDHGLARIGLAVSDETGLLARELDIIHRRSKREDFEKLLRHAQAQRVVGLVVGLPVNLEATEHTITHTQKVLNWVEYLKPHTDLPIILWDEQMSSRDAAELARQKRRTATAPIDDLAARVILQSYLDALRDGLAELPESLRR